MFNLENMFLNQEFSAHRIQLIQQNLFMKTKSVSTKLNDSIKYISETNLEETVLSTFDCQNKKTSTHKILPTANSLKYIKVSKKNQAKKTKNKLKNKLKSRKSTKNSLNSHIPDKKKKIQKIDKVNVKSGKRRIISLSNKKKNSQIQNEVNKKGRKAENIKNMSQKQNKKQKQNLNISQFEFGKDKQEKFFNITISNELEETFDGLIEIKMSNLERKQLEFKKDDLLKRIVEDWDSINKGRSQYRELRILGN